jgi:CRP-like cAMP-binding protein
MSRDDLEIVAGHTRFGFLKMTAGRQVIHAGEPCTHLYFLINGSLKVESFSDDGRYSVVEQMSSPYILQQESIFGYYQRYTHNFYALTDVNFLMLDKEEVVRL